MVLYHQLLIQVTLFQPAWSSIRHWLFKEGLFTNPLQKGGLRDRYKNILKSGLGLLVLPPGVHKKAMAHPEPVVAACRAMKNIEELSSKTW